MKHVTVFFVLLLLTGVLSAQKHISGKITNTRSPYGNKEVVSVSYRYDGKILKLTHLGGILNAAAKSTKGKLTIKGKKIHLKLSEAYDERGPVESLKKVDVSYSITGLSEGEYHLYLDDGSTEGGGGRSHYLLKIKKSGEDTVVISTKPEKTKGS